MNYPVVLILSLFLIISCGNPSSRNREGLPPQQEGQGIITIRKWESFEISWIQTLCQNLKHKRLNFPTTHTSSQFIFKMKGQGCSESEDLSEDLVIEDVVLDQSGSTILFSSSFSPTFNRYFSEFMTDESVGIKWLCENGIAKNSNTHLYREDGDMEKDATHMYQYVLGFNPSKPEHRILKVIFASKKSSSGVFVAYKISDYDVYVGDDTSLKGLSVYRKNVVACRNDETRNDASMQIVFDRVK